LFLDKQLKGARASLYEFEMPLPDRCRSSESVAKLDLGLVIIMALSENPEVNWLFKLPGYLLK